MRSAQEAEDAQARPWHASRAYLHSLMGGVTQHSDVSTSVHQHVLITEGVGGTQL